MCGVGTGTEVLVFQQVGVKRIVAVSKSKTAGFVVGCDHDERLFGMQTHEVVGYAYGIVHVDDFGEDRTGIVGVGGPVDFSAFDH